LLVRTATVFRLRELEADLVALLRDAELPRAEQLAALRALVEIGCEEVELFADVARASLPGEPLRREAAAALAGARSADAGPLLVELWLDLMPRTRRMAVERATAHREGAARLLAAVAAGDVEPHAFDTRALERMETLLGDEPGIASLRAALSSGGTRVLTLGGHTDDYVDTDVTLEGAFTVEAWVKLEGEVTNADGLLGVPGGADFNFHDRRLRVYAGAGLGDVIIAEKQVEPDRWTHVAVTRDDAGAFRIYVDGELDTDRCTPTQTTFADLDVCRTIPSSGTLGRVAELRVWSTARTAEEIGAWFRRALAPGEEPVDLLLRLPAEGAALHGGARLESTLDGPPILTAAEVRAEEERFARYRALATRGGDPERGREIFAESCLACHRVRGAGVAIGPVLDGAGAMGTEALLRSVLTPNAALETGYRTLVVRTHDGELREGFLVSSDDESLMLRRRDREDLRIPRSDVASAYFGSLSLMPEGLLEALTPSQVSDLFAYLTSLE
ncbi:MAG: c-type cytochrome, partial [Planctomycetota bacterium]|nr:c-type cytochrome [Planctomycetota bacterium]